MIPYNLDKPIKRIKIENVRPAKADVLIDKKHDCHKRTPLNHKNKELVFFFEIIARQRFLLGDFRSENTYAKIIAALKGHPKDIESYEEAQNITSIGPKAAATV